MRKLLRKVRVLHLLLSTLLVGVGLFWISAAQATSPNVIPCDCGGGSGIVYGEVVVSDSTSSTGTDTIDIWQNQTNSRETFQRDADTDATILNGNTLKVVTEDGYVDSIDQYPNSTDVWNVLHNQYGITQTAVDSALANGQFVASEPTQSAASEASLASRTPIGDTTYSEPYSQDIHYDSALGSLQTSLGFSIPQDTSLDGYTLIDSSKSRLYGPDTDDSGWTASMQYGSSTSKYDSSLSVNVATVSGDPSDWGDIYKSMVAATPDITGPGYAATLIDEGNQAVFQRGSTYVAVTATWSPTTSEWQTILSSLAN